MAYRVGALMYTPAINTGIADKLRQHAYPCLTALALCLEDSIQDSALPAAEENLLRTLDEIDRDVPAQDRPMLFVRIRTPEHLDRVHRSLGARSELLTGYVLPKFDLSNAEAYVQRIAEINRGRETPLFIMPTLESAMVADVCSRRTALAELKRILAPVKPLVLNMRVGGNDFSNLYGLRRSVRQNIYDVGVIRDILVDIVNVFGADYVVSGPVWEYFGADPDGEWAEGLRRELELDRLNGFTGKTAIHPSQLPVIWEGMKVSRTDYEDALAILGWDGGDSAVAKNSDGSRMNEVKCHGRWARRIECMGRVFGVREEKE